MLFEILKGKFTVRINNYLLYLEWCVSFFSLCLLQEHHLKAHQFTHTGLQPFTCPICRRAFNQKANMQRHQLIHNAERAFRCDTCSKTFTQPQTLKAHMVVHAESKPYRCNLCCKFFFF